MNFKNKSAFVTGGNRGLGRGFVEYFTDQGVQVFMGVRDPNTIDKKLHDNKNIHITPIDVASDVSIKKAKKLVQKQTKSIDFIVNNAGVNKDSATGGQKEKVCTLKDLDRRSLLTMFSVNSIGPMMVLKEFEDLLTGDPSFVINISSSRSSYADEFSNTNGNYGYRASKSALNMMTFCSLFDLPKNVKTFVVHPGGVKTDMNPDGTDFPYEQAKKIIGITRHWKEKFNGKFLRYNGVFYPLR